jgi:hypothetical protein
VFVYLFYESHSADASILTLILTLHVKLDQRISPLYMVRASLDYLSWLYLDSGGKKMHSNKVPTRASTFGVWLAPGRPDACACVATLSALTVAPHLLLCARPST